MDLYDAMLVHENLVWRQNVFNHEYIYYNRYVANSVFINGFGCVEQVFEGDQNANMLDEIIDQTTVLLVKQRKAHQPLHLLVNIASVGTATSGARKTAADGLKQIPCDKIAVFGRDTFTRTVASLVIQASGQGHKVRVFRTRTDARAWLSG
jgi:hypothetical protein